MSWQVGLYVAAVLLPLAAFLIQILGIRFLGRLNAYVATGAIALSFLLSLVGFVGYAASVGAPLLWPHASHERVHQEGPADLVHESTAHPTAGGHQREPLAWTGSIEWVSLGGYIDADRREHPPLKIVLGVFIDNLAVIMFVMVTFIATLIHVYSMGYMSDDPRYPRFFAYL